MKLEKNEMEKLKVPRLFIDILRLYDLNNKSEQDRKKIKQKIDKGKMINE